MNLLFLVTLRFFPNELNLVPASPAGARCNVAVSTQETHPLRLSRARVSPSGQSGLDASIGQRVSPFVFGVSGVSFDPVPVDFMRALVDQSI